MLSIVLSAVLVAGLLSVGATAASADPEGDDLRSYMPNLAGGAQLMSDRNDGGDALAHFTAVSSAGVTHTDWIICQAGAATLGGDLGLIDSAAELAQCDLEVGSDTSPVQLPGAGGLFPTSGDLAWDVFFDIPTTIDLGVRDVLVAACVGAGRTLFGAGKNCVQDYVDTVLFDDAQGGAGLQTSAGEFTQICTALTQADCAVATGGTRAEVDARFSDWEHGDVIPQDGATLRATTDADVTAASVLFTLAAADTTPGATVAGDACTAIDTGAQFSTWECIIPDLSIPDDSSLAAHLVITGDLIAAGAADIHGTFAVERAPASVAVSFDPDGDGPDEVCADPDTAETNALGDDEDVWGCVFDQFGDLIEPDPGAGQDAAFQSTGVGEVSDCDDDIDTDGDGETDLCLETDSDAAAGQFFAFASNVLEEGTQTITFCVDPEGDGCANAAAGLSATITKTWVSIADTIFLTYNGTATDTSTLFSTCTTGDTFRENRVGQTDDLLVCTFDAIGLPAPVPAGTNKPGGGRLQWFIAPSGGGELTATRFDTAPPNETGSDGTAIATLEAFRTGNDFITVDLNNEVGTTIASAFVQKRVTQSEKVRVESRIGIRGRFRGKVNADNARCERRRTVVLKKVRPGKDKTVGRDRTNKQGKWRINKPNAKGRFYARVQRQEKGNFICLGDRSKTVRRRR